MSDKDGQATAVSIVVRIKRFGSAWYRVLFVGARHLPFVTAPMRRQQFIHFCNWVILTSLPSPDGGRTRPKRPVLFFVSNYDGDVVRYMDTFARIIPWRMRGAWTPTHKFPDMFPPEPFHQWTVDNAYPTDHYWSAYPDATTRDVGRALRVLDDFEKLPSPTGRGGRASFERRWRKFLAARQRDL
ncbi:MAG: hypothetical protein QNM02_11040 [Acidimicrobiia bacterium]|nr:hypothetical protein [Acidimicrobiia bacterium]